MTPDDLAPRVDEGSTIGLRVFREGRLGFASTNQSTPEALEQLARDAAGLARVSQGAA